MRPYGSAPPQKPLPAGWKSRFQPTIGSQISELATVRFPAPNQARARWQFAEQAAACAGDLAGLGCWAYLPWAATAVHLLPPGDYLEVITDRNWLENTFLPQCQNRGAAVIKARGSSSALSAANGALDHLKSLLSTTPANDWVSAALISKGEYGVPAGLVFGYPCRSDGKGAYSVVEGLKLDAFGKQKFDATLKELLEEKEAVKDLLGG